MRTIVSALFVVLTFSLMVGAVEKAPAPQAAQKSAAVKTTGAAFEDEVGTGWSVKENADSAALEAAAMALKDKKQAIPDFAVVFATTGSDVGAIYKRLKLLWGQTTKLYGGTSDSRAVVTNKGFVTITGRRFEFSEMQGKRGLSIMTVSSKDVSFVVGSADLSGKAPLQQTVKAAVIDAIAKAGKKPEQKPRAVLITPTSQVEEESIEGIEAVFGKNTPILGGTAGGWECAVIGANIVFKKGVSFALVYTDLSVGWTYEGGFDVTDNHSGVVTKCADNYTVAQIDNRPALDVYNDWRGSELYNLLNKTQNKELDIASDMVTLHPLYRKYTAKNGQNYYLFQYLWLNEQTVKNKLIATSTKINVGDRLFISHGNWETLLNRLANLPKNAWANANIHEGQKPIFGIGVVCAGILGTIPEKDRPKIPVIMNFNNGSTPFIMNFTWGEQGLFPGVGNKHGNLLTSFLVVYK